MKRVVFLVVIVTSLFAIKNLVSSIATLWQKQDLVVLSRLQLEKEKQRYEQLQRQLVTSQSEQFIEEQARNKLFLGREGESVIILPLPSEESASKAATPLKKLNWHQWWELFF